MTERTNDNNEYTAQDFERYYNGKMSALEMHQLEKAAMEDPFLADALEGYSYTRTPVQDKEYLQAQLHSKAQGGKLVPLQRFNKTLRIAALFILLAGCGWAVYQFGFNRPSNNIAVLKKTNAPASSISTDTNKNESVPEALNTDTNTQARTVTTDEEGTVSLATQNRHTGRISANAVSVPKQKQVNEDVAGAGKKAEDANRDKQTFSLESRQATEGALANDMQPAKTDSGAIASSPQTVTPGRENVIVMQRNKSAAIPEVVLGKSMKDSNYRKAHITFEEAVPEKGTSYYDDYVARNLQIPEEEHQKKISGEVRLAFDINDAGQAVNITVEKSLCEACDREAVRLVQEGPKWVKKKKSEKSRVSIRF